MRIASVEYQLPEHAYGQDEILATLDSMWSGRRSVRDRLRSIGTNVQVERRHLAMPLEAYKGDLTFGVTNRVWIEQSLELGGRAVQKALAQADLTPKDVDAIFFVSVTGICSPSIDARLINKLGMRSDVKRMPIFGLGCVAGAAGVARAADYLKGFPDHVALVLSVELCSLTFQTDDTTIANIVSACLFADGACAAVLVGSERETTGAGAPGPEVLTSRSVFYNDTENIMGWDISEKGFQIVLSADVPSLVHERLGGDVDGFLESNGLTRSDIHTWICHPGGPKVLSAMQETLELPEDALAVTWGSMRQRGNLSSTSVMLVLADTLQQGHWPKGSYGLMLAMGPGFCSELVLLRR